MPNVPLPVVIQQTIRRCICKLFCPKQIPALPVPGTDKLAHAGFWGHSKQAARLTSITHQ